MQALDAYKRSSGRMFPTCSEILEVIRGLGYQRGGTFDDRPSDDTTEAEKEVDLPAVPALEESNPVDA